MTIFSKSTQKFLRGSLEVRATKDTVRGVSGCVVPAGTVGYVVSDRGVPGTLVVAWEMPRMYVGDNRTSVHDKTDVEPTGARFQ